MQYDELIISYVNSTRSVQRAWRRRFFQEISNEDLSPALAGILFTVQHMQPVSSAEVANEMAITRGAVTQFTDALVQRELIERTEDTDDRRVSLLTLTKAGNKKVQRLDHIRHRLTKDLVKGLNHAELRQAVDINTKILRQLQ